LKPARRTARKAATAFVALLSQRVVDLCSEKSIINKVGRHEENSRTMRAHTTEVQTADYVRHKKARKTGATR